MTKFHRCERSFYDEVGGSGLKNFGYLSGTPLNPSASGGGKCFFVIFGQIFEYFSLSSAQISFPMALSGIIASTGHAGSHMPQSIHSLWLMTSIFSPS